MAQRRKAEGGGARQAAPEIIQRQAGINDGKGFVFISHTGEIYPSGFLPLAAGNVRLDSLTAVYRESLPFRTLRDADNLQGKCGECVSTATVRRFLIARLRAHREFPRRGAAVRLCAEGNQRWPPARSERHTDGQTRSWGVRSRSSTYAPLHRFPPAGLQTGAPAFMPVWTGRS